MPAASQISRTAVASYPLTANRSSAVVRIRSAEVGCVRSSVGVISSLRGLVIFGRQPTIPTGRFSVKRVGNGLLSRDTTREYWFGEVLRLARGREKERC